MTTPESSPFDVAELTRLANEFFGSLPGGTDGSPGAATAAAPPASAAEVGVPTDTASASALAGGVAPDTVPAPLLGPPADTGLRAARVASPDVNTPPVPSFDQLAAIPDLLGDLLSLVPAVPGTTSLGAVPAAPPAQSGPVPLPTPAQLDRVGEWRGDDSLTSHAGDGSAAAPAAAPQHPPIDPPAGLGVSGVLPGALPGEGAVADLSDGLAGGSTQGAPTHQTATSQPATQVPAAQAPSVPAPTAGAPVTPTAAGAPAPGTAALPETSTSTAPGYAPTTAPAAVKAPAPSTPEPTPIDHAAGLPSSTSTASLGVYEFRPEMLPSLSGTSVAARPFDPYAIRRDFPIFKERVNGRPLVWLDNGATTHKPQAVIDRVSYYYEHENSNIHRAAHTLAARSTDAYEGAREKVRRFLNAGSASEIVFVRGTTEGINLVAKTWGAANIGSGDEILITHLEHHANIVPWQQLAQQVGATLKVAPVDDSGQVILSEYGRLISPRTKLVALTQVSNALGTVTPAAEMVEIARRRGALTLVDAAQSVLHMPVDVQALDADFLVFSGHKIFAPTGIGVVYGKADVWADTPPWQGGGNMIADVTFERTVYQAPPHRFEAGTGNIADAVGLGAALDYVTTVGLHNVSAYEHELLEYGTEGLLTIPGLRLVGTAQHKAAVMSFVLDGYTPEQVGAALDRDGIAVRAGHHCAQPILRRFGVEATVRPSLAMYNTREDLDCLVDSLRRLQVGRPRAS